MNPYAPSPIDQRATRALPPVILYVALLGTWLKAIVVGAFLFGSLGFAVALYAGPCALFVLSRTRISLLRPLNQARPTVAEFLVVLAICGVLHGLTLPGVTTNCIGRRQQNVSGS